MVRVFEDVISGRTFERPGLQALLDYARAGDALCVVRLDRLGRSLRELLETVDQLKASGIGLVSIEEKIDTSSAAGELVFHVFGAIAHFERRLMAERTPDGLAAAAANGRRPGRKPLDPEKLEAALALVDAGLSPTKAAFQVGIGRSTPPCCMDQSVNTVIAGAIGLMRCGRNSGVPSPACSLGQ